MKIRKSVFITQNRTQTAIALLSAFLCSSYTPLLLFFTAFNSLLSLSLHFSIPPRNLIDLGFFSAFRCRISSLCSLIPALPFRRFVLLRGEIEDEYVRAGSVGGSAWDQRGGFSHRRRSEPEFAGFGQGGSVSALGRDAAELAARTWRAEEEEVCRSGLHYCQP